MAVKHANTLEDEHLEQMLGVVRRESQHVKRDIVMVLLSCKAALRACEIAGLDWEKNLLDASGSFRDTIFIGSDIAKNGKERSVPIHPLLLSALIQLRQARPDDKPVIYSPRSNKPRLTANSVTVWFHRWYERAGLQGCSSHSGRRTFITRAARKANLHGNSLKDVQLLAGHARLETTEQYIDASPDQASLVAAL